MVATSSPTYLRTTPTAALSVVVTWALEQVWTNPVNVGFRPGWVMIKKATDVDNWMIFDKARGAGTSANDPYLCPNNPEEEVTSSNRIEFTDGFNVITGNYGQC